MAGYVIEDKEASIPAAHIIHVVVPKPYHSNWSISNRSPNMIVCLQPRFFMRAPGQCKATFANISNLRILLLKITNYSVIIYNYITHGCGILIFN